jgi:hypothetical protein
MYRSRPITAALTGGSVVVAASYSPMVLAMVAVIVLLVYLGVILPAVWSTKPTRRRDARHVLQQLLRLIREPRSRERDRVAGRQCGCPHSSARRPPVDTGVRAEAHRPGTADAR